MARNGRLFSSLWSAVQQLGVEVGLDDIGPQARWTEIQLRAGGGLHIMKNLITAIFAALMLAGALCAISGATSTGPSHSVAIVGEGTSPFPVLLSTNGSTSETTLASHF